MSDLASEIKNETIFQHRILSSHLESDLNEVYRYAGIFGKDNFSPDQQLSKLAEDSVKEIREAMNPRSVYIRFPLKISESDQITYDGKSLYDISFGNVNFSSHFLGLNLQDCNAIYLFAATLGPAVDKAIQKASRINAAKAVMLQASGAMFIEKYCDCLMEFLSEAESKEGKILCPRFSPGYGDIPLEMQKTFFELLQCQKNLALTLNNSLIMSPEKSVTAFIGIKKLNEV